MYAKGFALLCALERAPQQLKDTLLSLKPKLSEPVIQGILFCIGFALILAAGSDFAFAQGGGGAPFGNDDKIREATIIVLKFIEGNFGALIMVCAGVGSIMSAAFGQYRSALGLMVVAIGSFILRTLVLTFFTTDLDTP